MSLLSQIDIAALHLLVAVIDTGSISGGAARCHVSVAGASKRIIDIERRLGVQLLRRGPRGIVPTPSGEMFAIHARRMAELAGAMEEDLRDLARGIEGRIRVMANGSSILQFLPGDLAGFLQRHPRVRIDLEEHPSSAIAEMLQTDRADVGILESGHVPPGVHERAYRGDQLVLAVPMDHALARKRMADFVETLDYDYVGLHGGTAILSRMQQAAAEAGRAVRLRIQVRSFDTVCRMVEAGIGLGVMPLRAVEAFAALRRLKVVRLRDPWVQRRMVIAWPSQRLPLTETLHLIDWLHGSETRD